LTVLDEAFLLQLEAVFRTAIEEFGIEEFRKISWFGSNQRGLTEIEE
jgi:hypothetical protein